MSDINSNYWEQDVENLLQDSFIYTEIEKFLEDAYNYELSELEQMKLAIGRAKNAISKAERAALEQRILTLEKSDSMTFIQLAIELGLTLAGGTAIGLLTRIALGRILKNRLLYGTIRRKIRIPNSEFLSPRQRRKFKNISLGKKFKKSRKHNFFEFGMIDEIRIEDNSWEDIVFKSLPEINNELTKKLIEEKDNIGASSEETITPDPDEFFIDQESAIETQKSLLRSDYTALKRDVKYVFNDKEQLRNLVVSIKSNFNFEKVNELNSNQIIILEKKIYEDIQKQKILAQPILISAIFRMVFIPTKILPFEKGYEIDDMWYYSKVEDKPERVKASDPQKAVLKKLSKKLFVPELLYAKSPKLVTFAQRYTKKQEDPERAIIELTKYLNNIRFNEYISITSRLVFKYGKLLKALGLL